jgi:hypothetical protein
MNPIDLWTSTSTTREHNSARYSPAHSLGFAIFVVMAKLLVQYRTGYYSNYTQVWVLYIKKVKQAMHVATSGVPE